MATFEQLPGELNLKFVAGDEVQINCDFDVNITGYTISNGIYVTAVFASGGGGSAVTTVGEVVTSFDQTVTNAANGTLALVLPEEKSSLLTPAAAYRWYLRWVDAAGVTRTVLSGSVTPTSP